MTEAEYVQSVVRQADAYERTIQALVCLDSAIRYDMKGKPPGYVPGSAFMPGRRMDPAEPVTAPSPHPQTPDVVIQLTRTSGVVGEIKITASTDKDFKKAYDQVARYDTPLIGWCTPNGDGPTHDLFLLVDYIHAVAATQAASTRHFGRAFALLSMARQDQRDSFLVFEKRLGAFSDVRVEGKFANVVAVSLEKLLMRWVSAKFYDARPECVEYTMDVLWKTCVAQASETRAVERGGKKASQRKVDVGRARSDLEAAYSSVPSVPCEFDGRQPEVPQLSWVRDAMDALAQIGRAEKDDKEDGVYWVTYSSRSRNADIEGFAHQLYKRKRSTSRSTKPPKVSTPTAPQPRLPDFG